jgi:hypothetical protein
MKDAEGAFVHAENAQAAVDAAHHILVAATVTAQPADAPHLEPMGAAIAENTGRPPTRLSADAGYFSERAGTAVAPHTDLSSATEKVKHSQPVPPAPRGRIPKTLSVRERMHRKARTTAGRAVYAMRTAIVEPVFGQIKGARGFVHFLMRGQVKVRGEWMLVATAHDICRLCAARPAWRRSSTPGQDTDEGEQGSRDREMFLTVGSRSPSPTRDPGL